MAPAVQGLGLLNCVSREMRGISVYKLKILMECTQKNTVAQIGTSIILLIIVFIMCFFVGRQIGGVISIFFSL